MRCVASSAAIVAHGRRTTRRVEECSDMRVAIESGRCTWDEFQRLPDVPGVKYEFVYGELWVTPAPTDRHQAIIARLARVLDPYVEAQQLGLVFQARAVVRVGREMEVEPDLQVRQPHPDPRGSWETAPRPILVAEVVSPSSRGRDYGRKRELYAEQQIPEYWIVDGDARAITVVRPGDDPVTVNGTLTWAPAGASEPLTFDLSRVFG
jgi:Uma2 family endonuclease